VNSSGLLNLNGHSDTIGPLTMVGGDITTDFGATPGALILNGNVTSSAATPGRAATITGHLALGSSTRTFTVAANSPALPAPSDDMVINAVIAGVNVGLTKAGAGQLELTGTQANTYTGPTTVNAGTLRLNVTGGGAVPGTLV